MLVTGNQKISFTKGGTEWLALHQDLAGSCILQLFIHAWNHYYTINAVSSSEVVVTCTLERIHFLGLAVTIDYRST